MSEIRKALTAAVGTAVAALGAAMLDGQLTSAEGLVSLGTGLVVGFAAWRVPNAPAGSTRSARRRNRAA